MDTCCKRSSLTGKFFLHLCDPLNHKKPSYSTQTPNNDNNHHHTQDDIPPPSPPCIRQKISPPSPINNNNSQHRSNNYDISKVGHTIIDSLRALGLDIGANGIEVKVKYRSLSRIYHPDVHDPEKPAYCTMKLNLSS